MLCMKISCHYPKPEFQDYQYVCIFFIEKKSAYFWKEILGELGGVNLPFCSLLCS
jgi:hypothetical protein